MRLFVIIALAIAFGVALIPVARSVLSWTGRAARVLGAGLARDWRWFVGIALLAAAIMAVPSLVEDRRRHEYERLGDSIAAARARGR